MQGPLEVREEGACSGRLGTWLSAAASWVHCKGCRGWGSGSGFRVRVREDSRQAGSEEVSQRIHTEERSGSACICYVTEIPPYTLVGPFLWRGDEVPNVVDPTSRSWPPPQQQGWGMGMEGGWGHIWTRPFHKHVWKGIKAISESFVQSFQKQSQMHTCTEEMKAGEAAEGLVGVGSGQKYIVLINIYIILTRSIIFGIILNVILNYEMYNCYVISFVVIIFVCILIGVYTVLFDAIVFVIHFICLMSHFTTDQRYSF